MAPWALAGVPLMLSAALRRGLGVAAALAWAGHAAEIVVRGPVADLLWLCNVGGAVLAAGLLLDRPRLVGVATLWMAVGTPLWVLDLVGGSEIRASSVVSHAGGLAIALFVASRQWRRGARWDAAAGLAVLWCVSRLVTPPAVNVNLAFAVWPGWESLFPSHVVYVLFLGALCASVFAVLDEAMERVPREPAMP